MTFEIIPSVDIYQGEVVRLRRGDVNAKTVYSGDPVGVAMDWEAQGARRLHVVDLDGAMSGEGSNEEHVAGILRRVAVPVQVAGGIRSLDAAEDWLARGAERVVLGTKALTDEEFLSEAVERFGDHLIVAPDASDGRVRVSGWQEGTGELVVDAAKRLARAGVTRLLVTDISTDGMLVGPNVELFREIVSVCDVPVIASGGVSSVDDLRALAGVEGVEGAIVGKALYAGAFDLGDALKGVAA